MTMQLYLIRHGMTQGNTEGRYVGRTDEPLCAAGERKLRAQLRYMPDIGSGFLYVSGMKRCRESGRILFPQARQKVIPDFHECDFGEFEYRNYQELSGNPAYQRFIDSGGQTGFPGGETPAHFRQRIVQAFDGFVRTLGVPGPRQAAIVCHGGCIMAVLDRYAQPHRDYFDWQTACGTGFAAQLDTAQWAAGCCQLTQIRRIGGQEDL